MRVRLESECCGYLLIPVSKQIAKRMIHATGDESVYFQTDWDFPALASNLGWNMRSRKCRHDFTDGTVDCPDCGRTATSFITEAADWLSDHSGDTFNNRCVEEYFNTDNR